MAVVALLRRFVAATSLLGVLVLAASAAPGDNEPWRKQMEARLSTALERYDAIERAGGWRPVPQGKTLEPGDRAPRIEALRRRLEATGDATAGSDDRGFYGPSLEVAVRAFQTRHGLLVDGLVGPETLAALNAPVAKRVAALRLNAERVRSFEPRGHDYLLVNIPGFVAWLVRRSDITLETRVIVGKPSWPTPRLDSVIQQVIVNPYWTIPPSILAREIIPHIRRDPGYLASKNLRVFNKWGASARVLDPATVDWTSRSARNLRLRQEPGDGNALGRIKFQFHNRHGVYLHDTPTKPLFEKPARAFSHGCIRVQKPFELALALLAGQRGWDPAALQAAIDTGRNQEVDLRRTLPIHLVYWTAWVDEAGVVQFRRDVYKRDTKQGLMAEDRPAGLNSECSAVG